MPHFVYPSVNGHLTCFLFLTVMNNSAANIHVQVFVWIYVYISLRYISRRLLGQIVTLLSFLRNCEMFSKVSCTSRIWEFWFLHILVNTYYLSFELQLCCWYLMVVLISISLMDGNIEHLFLCLSALCVSLEKCQFNSFAHFYIEFLKTLMLYEFFVKSGYKSLIYMVCNVFSIFFSHFVGFLFTFLNSVLWSTNTLTFGEF